MSASSSSSVPLAHGFIAFDTRHKPLADQLHARAHWLCREFGPYLHVGAIGDHRGSTREFKDVVRAAGVVPDPVGEWNRVVAENGSAEGAVQFQTVELIKLHDLRFEDLPCFVLYPKCPDSRRIFVRIPDRLARADATAETIIDVVLEVFSRAHLDDVAQGDSAAVMMCRLEARAAELQARLDSMANTARRRSGRPARSDAQLDARIRQAWETHQYKTYAELGSAMRQTKEFVEKSLERTRKSRSARPPPPVQG